MAVEEGVEEGDTVVDDGIDVWYVSHEAVGEAVALVVDGADGESMLGYVNSGELHEPAGLAGEAVDDADCTYELGGIKRDPPLSEELEAAGIGDELGTVRHRVAGIELVGTQ